MKLHMPVLPVKPRPVTQFFPFGRGERGSRQRLVLEFSKWGEWLVVVHDFRLKVLRTHAPDLTVVLLGTSKWDGLRRRVFVQTRFVDGFRTFVQAVRDVRTIRKANKIWREKRRLLGGTGKF